jgi:phosphotriesterase-related protein
LVVTELGRFRSAGGHTVVDLTPADIGRNPEALRKIAESTGLNVVMGCGWYLQPTHPKYLDERTAEELATQLVGEIRNGVGPLSIRPGIIGEIGTSEPVHENEVRVLRAVAMAQRETGLAVSVHLQPWGLEGHVVLDALLAEGVAPQRIVLGHLNTAHHEAVYLRSLLDRGALLEFDLFGFDHSLFGLGRYVPSDADVATTVAGLVSGGFGDCVLLSQDIGVRTRLLAYGGWGYAHLLEHVVPLLLDRGLGDLDIDRMLVTNPRRVLEVWAQ